MADDNKLDLLGLVDTNDGIAAIVMLRSTLNLSLKEAKAAYDAIKQQRDERRALMDGIKVQINALHESMCAVGETNDLTYLLNILRAKLRPIVPSSAVIFQ